jgi:ElaB/YqjD/DUF883 family membrane-anchored ribosome-binding protein
MSETTPTSGKAENVYCPHLQEVDGETLQQLFSKVAAVRSENRELFDFTHRRIEVFRQTTGEDAVVSEDDVYRQFSSDRAGNFAVVIEGEVGTGKSELCAYLSHRLRDDGRPILHIDKDDDLMSMLTDRLPKFYEERFGEEMPEAADFEQLRDDIENIPQSVANNAVSGAILNLRSRGYSVSPTPEEEEQLRKFVSEKLNLLTQRGEYATEIKFVTEQEYRQEDFLKIFEQTALEEAVDEFNEELWRVVRNRYETASLSEVLKRVGKRFTETRPVIIFEDFAITAMEANKLASYIERDKPEDNWDFIIAGTRDSTRPMHTQTAEDRFEFYQTNQQDSNSVLFLDEDSAVDFVRPYLGYFKSFDDSVRYESTAEDTLELQPAPPGSRCANCGLCDESFRDLFPFNEVFLERVYRGLNKSEQSPREYIMIVFEILSDYYEGQIDAPSDAEALRPLVNKLSIADEVYERAEQFAHFARWYGRRNDVDEQIEIDRRFASAFGLVDSGATDVPDPVTVQDGSIVVPVSSDSVQRKTGANGENTSKRKTSTTTVNIDPVQQEYDEYAPTVEPWANAPGRFGQTNQYLKRGLQDALERLTDDFALYEGTSLRYNLSSQKYAFVFTNSDEAPDDDQIEVDPDEFRLSDLRKLLRFGIEREETPRSADYEEILSTVGTQLVGYAREWRSKLRNKELNSRSVLFKKQHTHNHEFRDFVLAAYSYVIVLDSPWKPISPETINNRFGEGEYEIDPDIDALAGESRELDPDEYDSINSLVEAGAELEELLAELYGISSSDLDMPSIRRWFERTSPADVLSVLGRNQIKNIESRVRFESSGSRLQLRSLADTAYDVRKALHDMDGQFRTTVVDEVRTDLGNLSLEQVRDTVKKLETYDDVSPDTMETLKRFTQVDNSAVETAIQAATNAQRLHQQMGLPKIQATLMSVKLEQTTAYQRFSSVQLEGSSGSEEVLGSRFRNIGEYYVE